MFPRIYRFALYSLSKTKWCHRYSVVRYNTAPAMVVSKTEILKNLRAHLTDQSLQAYIISSEDAHQSEYIAPCDARREYVSGFTGSAGTALVTLNEALLWTDGRYYLQASQELDSNWKLMKDGLPATPSLATWLSKNLPPQSKVGIDATLVSCRQWQPLYSELDASGHKLTPVSKNLVDLIWTDRSERPNNKIEPHPLPYSGRASSEKLKEINTKMADKHASLLTITALDQIAWLLNLRGQDIEYNPVFFSYVIIVNNELHLFIEQSKITGEIKDHFAEEKINIVFHPYEDFYPCLKEYAKNLPKPTKAWVSPTSAYAVSSVFPQKQVISEITPIPVLKAIKNSCEIQGLVNAHIKDAVALCCYFSWLEKQVANGELITEVSGAKKLLEFRATQKNFKGASFETISAVGPHGSIIHYRPTPETDRPITGSELYLCDSGAQFKDGTTDVTRTIHFGTPTPYEKECFTRVFKGQAFLGTCIFPSKVLGNTLDSLARKFLWDVGLNYGHGTGHGIGAFLNVHEGPMGITWKNMPDDPGLQEGMFLSNEPGYYEDDKFGIRLEDIVRIVKANTPHNHADRGFLTFETVTLVPIQTKMLDRSLLTKKEIDYLNSYHKRCRDIIGPLLEQQKQTEALEWLNKETIPI